MKFEADAQYNLDTMSRPARGAWIEIRQQWFVGSVAMSRPARGAWIEIGLEYIILYIARSRPARGAWIEIFDDLSIAP